MCGNMHAEESPNAEEPKGTTAVSSAGPRQEGCWIVRSLVKCTKGCWHACMKFLDSTPQALLSVLLGQADFFDATVLQTSFHLALEATSSSSATSCHIYHRQPIYEHRLRCHMIGTFYSQPLHHILRHFWGVFHQPGFLVQVVFVWSLNDQLANCQWIYV